MKLRFLIASAILITIIVMIVRSFGSDSSDVSLPVGPQTLTGVLLPTPLSLDRRGTHLLRVDDTNRAFIESSHVSLREFEGLLVSIQGIFEANSDPEALPVLVASGVTLITQPSRLWTVPALQVRFESPITWDGQLFDDGIRMIALGTQGSVMQVYRAGVSSLPEGASMQVAGQRAVLTSATTGPTVFVQSGTGVVAFSFAADSSSLTPEQLLVLRSVQFLRPTTSSSPIPSFETDPNAPILPCGGVGGVLCPAGSYCEITNTNEGFGVCKPMR